MPSSLEEHASRQQYWHQSTVDAIINCGRRYWAEYVADLDLPGRVQAAAGTAFHAALNAHEQARVDGHLDGITREEMKAVAATNLREAEPHLDPVKLAALTRVRKGKGRGKNRTPETEFTGIDALLFEADAAVDNFFDALIPDPHADVIVDEDGEETHPMCTPREWLMRMTPLASEVYVRASLVRGARDMAGTIDGVYWDPTLNNGAGGIRLVDAKTSWASLSDWRNPDNHRDQAVFYSVLSVIDTNLAELDARLPAPQLPVFTYLVVRRAVGTTKAFTGAALLEVQPVQKDIPLMADRIRSAEKAHAEAVFLPNPAYRFCAEWSCPIYDRCLFGDKTLAGPIT